MKHRLILLLTIAPLASGASLPAQPAVLDPGPETEAPREARLGWWRASRFGIFIHWGHYAIPGRREWVQWNEQIPNEEYAKLADEFKPAHFDADAWAATIESAGAKYAVLPALPDKVLKATRLDGSQVPFVQGESLLEFTVPAGARDAIDTIIKLELDGSAGTLSPLSVSGK